MSHYHISNNPKVQTLVSKSLELLHPPSPPLTCHPLLAPAEQLFCPYNKKKVPVYSECGEKEVNCAANPSSYLFR